MPRDRDVPPAPAATAARRRVHRRRHSPAAGGLVALPGRGLTEPQLPRLAARDLAGGEHALPDGLPADPCVVVLAFRRRHQRDVDAWVAALPPNTPVVEVPLLSRRWRAVSGWIEGGMATGTPAHARPRVWCAYASVSGVLSAIGQRGAGQVAVVVADRSGAVRAVARGAPAPAAVGAIVAATTGGQYDSAP